MASKPQAETATPPPAGPRTSSQTEVAGKRNASAKKVGVSGTSGESAEFAAQPETADSTTADLTTAELSSIDLVTADGDSISPRRGWLPSISWKSIAASRKTPSFLVSFIFHCALLLALAILSIQPQLGEPEGFAFQARSQQNSDTPQQTELTLAAGDSPPPPAEVIDDSPDLPQRSSVSGAVPLSELLQIDQAESAQVGQVGNMDQLLEATGSSLSAAFASTGVSGRQPERRRELALARGGTLESEKAVEAALDWLAEHQRPTGAWSLIHSAGACNGRCGNDGSKDRFDAAATGLSLLAYLGAGYTHRAGKHRETVRKGVYFLLQIIEETPEGGSFLYQSDRGMYNHGIAAFALCEAYQLSGDKDLKEPAQRAIDFIASAQSYQGGWGYLPRQPGDLTLSGWQIMALKSAFAAGLYVPPSAILRIDPFLDTQMASSGVTYGYRRKGASPTCTAIGMLVRLFRDWMHTDPRIMAGADFLLKSGPTNSDVYFNYYATLTLFHLGAGYWDEWNPKIREHLVNTQVTQGHEAGSWYFDNPFGKEGGRLYTTAMCAMTLEVYYRFSPLYQQTDQPFEL